MTVLRKWNDFNGRARRKEFWMFVLFFFVFFLIMMFAGSFLGAAVLILFNIALLLMVIPYLAVTVRRLHDVGKSGWFMLIPIYRLILTLTAGNVGPNEYGPDPKGGAGDISDHLVDNETV